MISKYSADYLFDGDNLIENGWVVFEGETIKDMGQAQKSTEFTHLRGLLMPGFVNTHCHLELSHLKSKVATGTGLLQFLKGVLSLRNVEEAVVLEAINTQDECMWNNGIQAVGDICNRIDTFATKENSSIHYYSFVEMFDMLQDKLTDSAFYNYAEVYEQHAQSKSNQFSAVPHAPYSVTKKLFENINQLNKVGKTISIHNQETNHENNYFLNKSGAFSSFFKYLKLDDTDFTPTGRDSIYYAMDHMDSNQQTLFVHNTMTTRQNILDAHAWNKKVYWATCPNANLFIENRLPDYQGFIDCDAKVTIGTDSLSSNWQLSILEEMKTIQKFNSYVEVETLLTWSTSNGAKALQLSDKIGSFISGLQPGLIHLAQFDGKSLQNCEVKRII